MKAILHYRPSAGFKAQLEAACPSWLDIVYVPEDDRTLFEAEMADTSVILHILEPVTDADMALAPNLGLVQKIGVGVNTIDREGAARRNVAVANMPGTNNPAVAETTLLLMLSALRQATLLDRQTRAGKGWDTHPDVYDNMGEIGGRTVGLVGYGAVPTHLAPVLVAMGARVLYTAQSQKPDAVAEWASLDDLVAQSDIVSLHVPLTDQTEHLVDADLIARMKPGSVLVNTARGGLVDEAALLDALDSGHIRAAGLDVFAREPVYPANKLLRRDNVVTSPHVAWLTPETLARSIDIAVENCRRLKDGEALLHQVHP
jgi:phosphoglycerate dehydrogenase-like enzyme